MRGSAQCGICRHDRGRPVLKLADPEGNPGRLVKCEVCALVQIERPPAREELHRYYARYCYESEENWESSPATEASITGVAGRLARYRENGRLLDVGSGAGFFLSGMAARGWSVEGTELSDVAAARLRSAGFAIHVGELETLGLSEGHYDVVIMSELLEHLLEPRQVLDAAFRTLRPGGALYLTTPNFGSLSRRLIGKKWRGIGIPEHLCYFTEESLSRLLTACSYRVSELWTDGINPYELRAAHADGGEGGSATPAAARAATERLRLASLESPAVGAAKKAVNLVLRVLGLGDTLKAVAERPSRRGGP